MLQAIRCRQPADAAANNHHIVPRRGRWPREHLAIADLMADAIVFAIHFRRGIVICAFRLRNQRQINRTSGGYRSRNHKFDEISSIRAHAFSPSAAAVISAPTSARPSARTRNLYHSTMATSENTKMMAETALISGVMPRRNLPQISSGNVLSRPIRKKLTAISSIESVKINNAAPMMDNRKLGIVTRQNVCQ